ncbi:hypothetical protein llap_7048 [Limosa lapponica baueri]|uniref:Uncharacterized protein n=1 Tax=Limosa lapponica baueri TaxID=1758121 RepID=A0A2I0U9E4_LIMLA|nr:hypothetical protein llap_7048 [Limosa lapponica baueri]
MSKEEPVCFSAFDPDTCVPDSGTGIQFPSIAESSLGLPQCLLVTSSWELDTAAKELLPSSVLVNVAVTMIRCTT